LYTAAQALDLRLRQNPDAQLGRGTGRVYQRIRETVSYQPVDAWWGPEIEKVRALIMEKQLEFV
jgi:histidine ammonia-lyase